MTAGTSNRADDEAGEVEDDGGDDDEGESPDAKPDA